MRPNFECFLALNLAYLVLNRILHNIATPRKKSTRKKNGKLRLVQG